MPLYKVTQHVTEMYEREWVLEARSKEEAEELISGETPTNEELKDDDITYESTEEIPAPELREAMEGAPLYFKDE